MIDLSINETHVSPREITLYAIKSSEKNIYACIYKLNDIQIYNQLILALKNHVHVELVMDYKMNKYNKLVHDLKEHGAKIYYWKKSEKLHAKFVIIDNKHVLTGSYNWTFSNKHKIDLIMDADAHINEFLNLYKQLKISSEEEF